jgi:hypothetical protein
MIIPAIKRSSLPLSRRSATFSLAREAGEGWGQGNRCILATILLVAVIASVGNPAPTAAQSAPRVSVVFVEPDKFTDVRYSEAERSSRALLLQLQRFIVDTAVGYLPESLRLEIKITDIDMAGDFEIIRGPQFDQVRVNKSVYPPRIALEFRILDGGEQTVKEGKRDLTDMDYQLRTAYPRDDYLRYEKELLRDWLRAELGVLSAGTTN